MFFRRQQQREPSFAERLSALREAGFRVQEKGPAEAVVRRGRCVAVVEQRAGPGPRIAKSGYVFGDEAGYLTSKGFQTVWTTPSGKQFPATAEQLETYHDFLEDLREYLGLPSLYNESLGTTHAVHRYDRVAGRESEPKGA